MTTPKPKPSAMGTRLRAAPRASEQMLPSSDPAEASKAKKAPSKERMNLYLEPEIADRVRDAIYALGRRYTLGSLVAEFLPANLAELEERYNDGKPFPHRPEDAKNLTSGPPILIGRRDRS